MLEDPTIANNNNLVKANLLELFICKLEDK